MGKRKRNSRNGTRNYRPIIVISTEGAVTEIQYFKKLNGLQKDIQIVCLTPSHKSSPKHVLKRMKDHLNESTLKKSDQAWIVVDRNNWIDQELDNLYQWSMQNSKYDFAVSNPNFEFWLLLHYEDGKSVTTGHDCIQRLKRHLPQYTKQLDKVSFRREQVLEATNRAEQKDKPPVRDWPRDPGVTTVYRLVKRVLEN